MKVRDVRRSLITALLVGTTALTLALGHVTAPPTSGPDRSSPTANNVNASLTRPGSDIVNAALTWEHRGLRQPRKMTGSIIASRRTWRR
jgi:hypothetical protein